MAIKSRKQVEHALRHAGDFSFKTKNMDHIPSLKDLGNHLSKMRKDVYDFHVGDGFNHFSRWVHDVFGDEKLAKEIFSQKSKKASSIVKKRVKWLEKKLK